MCVCGGGGAEDYILFYVGCAVRMGRCRCIVTVWKVEHICLVFIVVVDRTGSVLYYISETW